MLLIYTDAKKWEDLGDEDKNGIMGQYFAYTQALVDAGAMVSGEPLQGVETAKTVEPGGVVTDGPFADTTEHLGGFYIVDAPSSDAACEWAGKVPDVVLGIARVEVRPLMEMPA